jgi:chorismate mutase / prephenate dehydratase
MQQVPVTLEDLRDEIDKIDDAVQDLLARRARISRSIARLKLSDSSPVTLGAAMRPAREALILRRLLARRPPELAPQLVVGIWREIISSSLRAQTSFHAHVYAGGGETAYVGLARAYFGSETPIRTHGKPSLVIHACAEEQGALGVVPLPLIEEPGPAWWAQLAPAGERGPRIIAKLPVVSEGDDVSAYAIGAIEQEPTGDDTTLLLLEVAPGKSRTKLPLLLKDVGLSARLAAAGRIADKNAPDEVLLEVKGFVGKGDPRLASLAEAAGGAIARIIPIGGFANPVMLSSLAAQTGSS